MLFEGLGGLGGLGGGGGGSRVAREKRLCCFPKKGKVMCFLGIGDKEKEKKCVQKKEREFKDSNMK